MIGKLQSNKVKYVIPLFDYAFGQMSGNWRKISKEQIKKKKSPKFLFKLTLVTKNEKWNRSKRIKCFLR